MEDAAPLSETEWEELADRFEALSQDEKLTLMHEVMANIGRTSRTSGGGFSGWFAREASRGDDDDRLMQTRVATEGYDRELLRLLRARDMGQGVF